MSTAITRLLLHKNFVTCCLIAFAAIRAALIFTIPVEMTSDAAWYLHHGMLIASGEGYTEAGHPTAYWPVGYPAFLAAVFAIFGNHVIAAQLANLLLSLGTFLLVLDITRRIFRNEIAARLAVLLLTFYPNNIAYNPLLLTETFYTFLILLGFWLYLKGSGRKWALLTGLVFGYAALTKPQTIFLPGLMILLKLLQRRDTQFSLKDMLFQGAIVYGAMALILVPWAIRNTLAFHEVVLVSTNGGAALLAGNNPSAKGGGAVDDPLFKERRWSVADQVASDKRARTLAVAWIREHPWRFFELMPIKAWHLWIKDGDAEWAYEAGYSNYDGHKLWFRSARVVNQIYYYALILGCIASIFLMRRHLKEILWPHCLFGYLLIAYTTLLCAVLSGQIRYHFPAMPWIIMYAAWAIALYLSRRQTTADARFSSPDTGSLNG